MISYFPSLELGPFFLMPGMSTTFTNRLLYWFLRLHRPVFFWTRIFNIKLPFYNHRQFDCVHGIRNIYLKNCVHEYLKIICRMVENKSTINTFINTFIKLSETFLRKTQIDFFYTLLRKKLRKNFSEKTFWGNNKNKQAFFAMVHQTRLIYWR